MRLIVYLKFVSSLKAAMVNAAADPRVQNRMGLKMLDLRPRQYCLELCVQNRLDPQILESTTYLVVPQNNSASLP